MHRLTRFALFVVFAAMSVMGCSESAITSDSAFDIAQAKPKTADGLSWLGNGLPSGPHFNLNVIGTTDKQAAMDDNNGRRIFVPLWGNAKIYLSEGPFQVLDANGTDGNGAAFQLPSPDVNCDGTTEYSVFVRELGKPGGAATVQSCYTDATSGTDYCASDVDGGVLAVDLSRDTGKPKTTNVSRDLLYVDYCMSWTDLNGDLAYTMDECDGWVVSPLFADELASYFWDYDNRGLRLAQFRFYDVETLAHPEVYCPEG